MIVKGCNLTIFSAIFLDDFSGSSWVSVGWPVGEKETARKIEKLKRTGGGCNDGEEEGVGFLPEIL